MEQFRYISLRNLIFKVLSFILLIVSVRTSSDVMAYAFISVFGTAGNCIVNIVSSPKFVKFTFHGLNFRRHYKSIFFLVAVNLAIELYSLIDVTMMNFWCSKSSIAYYKYGHGIEKMLLQVVNTFTIVLIPRISYYYKKERIEDFNRLVSKAFKLIVICAVPMIIGILFTSDFLITKMYGEQYLNSAQLLKIFSSLLLVSPIGYLLGSRVLLVTGHENQMIISVGIGAVINILGNALLIPRYAEFGAAIASVISEIVVMVTYVILGNKYFRLCDVQKTILRVVLSACIMTLYLTFINCVRVSGWVKLVLQVAGACLSYILSLYMVKEDVTIEYMNIFKSKLTGFRKH